MKRFFLPALALALLLTACGPSTPAGSDPDIGSRPPSVGELLPPVEEDISAGQPLQPDPQPEEELPPLPDPETLSQWRAVYSDHLELLGQTLYQLADAHDMTVYSRWPDGRERARVENTCLLFSGPADQDDSRCAAIALDLPGEYTLADLREEWGDALTFRADDPLTGPCWTVSDGDLTFRFRTDSAGEGLLPSEQGGSLVLSRESLLPQAQTADWIAPADTWVELWAVSPSAGWEPLLPYFAALGSSAIPEGATQTADPAFMDLFFSQRGLKDPDTGAQYFSYEENSPWDGVVVPASLVFGSNPPRNADQLMSALNTPFWWGVYNLTGYWFYVDQYSIFLSSDDRGAVGEDSFFLLSWGDNAGP